MFQCTQITSEFKTQWTQSVSYVHIYVTVKVCILNPNFLIKLLIFLNTYFCLHPKKHCKKTKNQRHIC